jgi:hypothetical protein
LQKKSFYLWLFLANEAKIPKAESIVKNMMTYVFKEMSKNDNGDGLEIISDGDKPLGVIMMWDKYQEMLDEIQDQYLVGIAEERLKRLDRGESKTIPWEEMMAELGITQEELDEMEDVEIE